MFEPIEADFRRFFETAQRALRIKTEEDYRFALDLVEHLMTKAEDREGEVLLPLIDLVANAIDAYEESTSPEGACGATRELRPEPKKRGE